MLMLTRLFALFYCCHFVIRCHGGKAFDWAIPNAVSETPLLECETYSISLKPLNGTTTDIGTPPNYMMVIALPDAVSAVSHIGDNSSSLSWQVQNRRGGRLLLTVIDSNGQTGGFPNTFYNVVAGQTQCLPPAPLDPPVIAANVTTTINTCDPWGLFITGGVKPYHITLATPTSPSMTNVTMGPDDDVYTYINRAAPGTQLVAAVVDAKGQWGISSLPVNTTGSTDTDCMGLLSSSSSQTISSEASPISSSTPVTAATPSISPVAMVPDPPTRSKRTLKIALGVVFGSLALLAFARLGFVWLHVKITRSQAMVGRQDIQPRSWDTKTRRPEMETYVPALPADSRASSHYHHKLPPAIVALIPNTERPTSIDAVVTELHTPISTPSTPSAQESSASTPMTVSIHSPDTQPRALPSIASPMMQGCTSPPTEEPFKVRGTDEEATLTRFPLAQSPSSYLRSGSSNANPLVTLSPVHPPSLPPQRVAITEVGRDILIQHRDGGVVEELPPP